MAIDKQQVIGVAGLQGELTTAAPRPAYRFIAARSYTTNPQAVSWASMFWRARASGVVMNPQEEWFGKTAPHV